MNFGGLVAGAIGGLAKGAESIADDQIKRNDKLMLLRAEMDAKLRQELAQEQRLGQWADKVEQGAKARGEQRDFGLVGDIKKAVPDEGPFAGQQLSEADKEMLRNLSPEQRKAFGMEDKTLLRDLQLQGEEARATGAPKAIRDGIKEGQSAEIARVREDRGERTAATNERTANARLDAQAQRDAETARANREAERLAGIRAEALMRQAGAAEARAANQGAGGGRAPSGYRFTASGTLEFIPGGPADPATKSADGKPMPASAAKGLLENQANLRRAQQALELISGKQIDGGIQGDQDATGWKNVLPNQVLNRMDPKGVDTRAAIADLGSMVIHDRSGAAVTASEFPRLAPFVPTATDDPATVRKKLTQFVRVYQDTVADSADFYSSMGYRVPTDTLRSGTSRPSSPASSGPAKGGGYSKLWN